MTQTFASVFVPARQSRDDNRDGGLVRSFLAAVSVARSIEAGVRPAERDLRELSIAPNAFAAGR